MVKRKVDILIVVKPAKGKQWTVATVSRCNGNILNSTETFKSLQGAKKNIVAVARGYKVHKMSALDRPLIRIRNKNYKLKDNYQFKLWSWG